MKIVSNKEVRDHLHQFLDHFSQLSKVDLYNRFFSTLSPSAIRDWLMMVTETPNSHYFVVEEDSDGRFIGVATLAIDYEANDGDIAVSVISEHRGKGIAKAMLEEVISFAKSLELSKLWFETQPSYIECKKLFGGFGFVYHYDCNVQCTSGSLDIEVKDE